MRKSCEEGRGATAIASVVKVGANVDAGVGV